LLHSKSKCGFRCTVKPTESTVTYRGWVLSDPDDNNNTGTRHSINTILKDAVVDDIPALLRDISNLASGPTWNTFLALAAAGTISMGTLEVVKALTPIRERYQRRWFKRWLAVQIVRAHAAAYPDLRPDSSETMKEGNTATEKPECRAGTAEAQLVTLATGGNPSALYSMAAEDMIPVMNLAALIVLDEPRRYLSLLRALSAGVAQEDFKTVCAGPDSLSDIRPYMLARERAARRIQRNLDGARLALGSAWKLRMQVTSIGLTILIIEATVLSAPPISTLKLILAVPIALVGGYLAPITRDLLAALQQLRDP
jgi:hypothetical protein